MAPREVVVAVDVLLRGFEGLLPHEFVAGINYIPFAEERLGFKEGLVWLT